MNALRPFQPYLRGAPPGIPFASDMVTIRTGLNVPLTTTLGNLDLLGESAGGGTYDSLRPHSETIHVFGADCLCLGLEKLIHVKRAAGRPKDLEVIAELQTIRSKAKR